MNAPDLNRKLVLEDPVRADDGSGGYSVIWSPLGTLWAAVEALTGRERGGVGGAISLSRYRITVRGAPVGANARPAPGQRFRDGTRLFAIRAVSEADPAGHYLTCVAEEERAT